MTGVFVAIVTNAMSIVLVLIVLFTPEWLRFFLIWTRWYVGFIAILLIELKMGQIENLNSGSRMLFFLSVSLNIWIGGSNGPNISFFYIYIIF